MAQGINRKNFIRGIDVRLFFDRAGVAKRLDARNRRILGATGAFGRKVVRNSMRYSNKTSKPGEPPRAHTGQLRNLILFQLHPATDSVIVGAAKFNQKRTQTVPAPQLLEDGGRVVVRRFRGRRKPLGPPQTWHYRARPFIAPGMVKTVAKMRQLMETTKL